jgi:hypothetical protein
MEHDGTKGERRQKKRAKKREMKKSGRSFVVAVRAAVEKRMEEIKKEGKGK